MDLRDIQELINLLEISNETDEHGRRVEFVRTKLTHKRVTPTYLPSCKLVMYPDFYLGKWWLIVGYRNTNNSQCGARDYTAQAVAAVRQDTP